MLISIRLLPIGVRIVDNPLRFKRSRWTSTRNTALNVSHSTHAPHNDHHRHHGSLTVDQLVDTLKLEEGFRSKPYRDSRGFLTIGYGTNLSIGITPVEGEILSSGAAGDHRAALWRRHGSPYQAHPDAIRAALLDMSYQLGIHGLLGFHKMLV